MDRHHQEHHFTGYPPKKPPTKEEMESQIRKELLMWCCVGIICCIPINLCKCTEYLYYKAKAKIIKVNAKRQKPEVV